MTIRVRLFLLVLFAACTAVATRVSLDQARTAVGNWLSTDPALGCRMGASVLSARTCELTNGAACHVVRLAEGGFVVTSADTKLEPIIAFSDDADLVQDDRNPLWVLLKRDLVARARSKQVGGASLQSVTPATVTTPSATESKWAKLLSGGARLQGLTSVSDVRVAPLVQSKWGQDQNSIYVDVGEENCYNYFTPNNYPCGCTATALAQIMRYHCHPRFVTAVSRSCAVDGTTRKLTMKGGAYDYANMPLVPEAYSRVSWYSGGASSGQCEAIGKLTYDCGVAMQMDWHSEGSGAGGAAAHGPLKSIFGYKNAHTTANGLSDAAYRSRIILTNLDARYPVLVGINGECGGHEVIADGYGYSGDTLYTHLNLGWSGLDDAWYALPDIDVEESFNAVTHLVYNVFPQEQGEIVSGRIVSSSGSPITGAPVEIRKGTTKVKESVTDSRGIFSFVVSSSVESYTVVATYGEGSVTRSVNVTASVDSRVTLKVGSYSYYPNDPAPNCGNVLCGDLVLSSVASVDAPVLSPADCVFHPTTNVTISCAAEGATIRYTVDGTDPTENSTVYSEPIAVTTTTTIKARAFKSGYSPSSIVAATYTFALPGDCFAGPLRIAGASGTHTIPDMGCFSLEFNEPLHTLLEDGSYSYQFYSAWYEWTAPGAGEVSFTTRCAGGGILYPTAVAVYSGDDLAKASRLAMSKDYRSNGDFSTTVSLTVQEGETYRIAGVVLYELPREGVAFSMAWRGNLTTTRVATSGTDAPVPYTWLDLHFPGSHGADDYEALANADQDGDGFATWQEYVLDTDPTDAASALTASIRMEGATPVVEWSHTNATIEALGYRYAPKGRTSLVEGDWADVDPSSHRFFKVVVEPCR